MTSRHARQLTRPDSSRTGATAPLLARLAISPPVPGGVLIAGVGAQLVQVAAVDQQTRQLSRGVPGVGAGRARHRMAQRTCYLPPDRTLKQDPARRRAGFQLRNASRKTLVSGTSARAQARRGGPASEAVPGPIRRARHGRA
jgi:hypothetical protein